jgi:uncharacterized protein YfaS (alpha-2-macroglobulin family)
MSLSTALSVRIAVALVAGAVLDPGEELHVLRVTPSGDAAPTSSVTITFDRPVAGSLDRIVDPKSIFSLAPATAGTLDWRDPVTLRFRPASPLTPNTSYTVIVADRFEAMDGSRLRGSFTFSFRVRGPRVLAGWPTGPSQRGRFLVPETRFDLVVDAPADSSVVASATYLELDRRCPGAGVIRLAMEGQRPVTSDDRWDFREAGGWNRDRSADPLRRVVRFVPRQPLPRGCTGNLVAPASYDEEGQASLQRWEFSTYGDFNIVRAGCGWGGTYCPTGPLIVTFSTPVRGAEVLKHVSVRPTMEFRIGDTTDVRTSWALEAPLKARTGYALVADNALRDDFRQALTGNPVATMKTTGFAPAINYQSGRSVVERKGARTFGLSFVNVDTLETLLAPVPDSLESQLLARNEWSWDELWPTLLKGATRQRIAVRGERDRVRLYGLKIPAPAYARVGVPTLMALQITSGRLDTASRARRPIALVQVTDLGLHARVGVEEGVVWVTSASDGRPRVGVAISLHDAKGKVIARATTDSAGLARLTGFATPTSTEGNEDEIENPGFQGYVSAVDGTDRALLGINEYDPDLSPWRFNVSSAWETARLPVAAAVFTERDIYRPGEPVYAKAIVRRGKLGTLETPLPGDSLRWVFEARQEGGEQGNPLRDTTVALSEFGTADQHFSIPTGAPLGEYRVVGKLKRAGRWTEVASTFYRVAEYRAPEFLVSMSGDSGVRHPGDSVSTTIEARYLFGAPMGRAAVRWTLRQQSGAVGGPDIPNADGYYLTETGWWYEEMGDQPPPVRVAASGIDTLDARGRLSLHVELGETERGRPSRATIEATVTDVNRQTVSASTSLIVHPADFYLGAKPEGSEYFWLAGRPVSVNVIAVRPGGERVTGVRVAGTFVRREWHQVRRDREGYGELVGEWVSDTVGGCNVLTAAAPAVCRFTPPAGGTYIVSFRAADSSGREVVTSFYRWATGKDWVPWNDESQFKMDVIPDRTRYSVGDTATVLFASPFTGAEAWVTVEREGLIEQRRMRIESGTTMLRLPITEALAPNAFVSVVVARGRSAPPGPLDDPGRPTIRVGYAELRVTPEKKRLKVDVSPLAQEYRPGDTARVAIVARDADGTGQRSEVTLWAVDEGVLALTGFRTPDPLDLLYQPRGLGMRLASTLTTVAPQVAEGEKGKRAPGGGGGQDGGEVLRSRFQSTAFFLGSVITGADGRATAAARLPDNLTTFRVMAVAVTTRDRYGSGQSSLLVTRPLVARPALPRFLRDKDKFAAGVVVNTRTGGTPKVKVKASSRGAEISGKRTIGAVLEAGRGREVRFDFEARPGDSASFRFDASSGKDADAVSLALPVRPAYQPKSYTVAGVVYDTASVELPLPDDIDPARSNLHLSLGTSPLALIRGAWRWLRVYPYWCSEQVASAAEPLVAIYRAGPELGVDSALIRTARNDLERAVTMLSRRQRADGGIGLWSAASWTTPWLSAYAGSVLLDAKTAGVAVDDSVLARLAGYLEKSLGEERPLLIPVAQWYTDPTVVLSDRVMAVDYLSRAGVRARAAENELLRVSAQLAWEDRVRLALVMAREGERESARRLLAPAWAATKVEGRTATLPPASRRSFYFYSPIRPAAYLLSATLAVQPDHPLIGPLVETLVAQGRSSSWIWNTQDYGTAVNALLDFQRRQRAATARGVRVTVGGKVVFDTDAMDPSVDRGVDLRGLAIPRKGQPPLHLTLTTGSPGASAATPLYYYLTATTVPTAAPVRPDDHGIQVERWYERYADGKPLTSVAEGDLVRVRIKVTVPSERNFVVVDDPLPAGLEAVDLSLLTVGGLPGPGAADSTAREGDGDTGDEARWVYGSWDGGWWSPFDYKELRDDRVVYVATRLWKGSYTASYLARATTPGTFAKPPAHGEEMYNPAVFGESDGGTFTVTAK